MATLSWSVKVQVSGGTAVTHSRPPLEVEATDLIEVSIQPGDTHRVIDLQPGRSSAVHLLVIKSSSNRPYLSFRVGDETIDSSPLILEKSPDLLGWQRRTLFGVPHADWISPITANSSDKRASVEILVARDAAP